MSNMVPSKPAHPPPSTPSYTSNTPTVGNLNTRKVRQTFLADILFYEVRNSTTPRKLECLLLFITGILWQH